MIMISVATTSLIVNIHLLVVNDQLRKLQRILYAYTQHIDEINHNPSAWVNRTVLVEGKLCGPSIYIPESVPPWNYELFGPNETIETLGKQETVAIGVLWNGEDQFSFENVIVIGVIREGRYYSWGNTPVCYYIEAQEITRLRETIECS